MFKISVSNIHGGSWTSNKDTLLEAEQWIEKHKKNGTFGKPERKVREDKKPRDLEYKEVPKLKLDPVTYELVFDENDMPEYEGVEYEVIYPCEYEIKIEEVGSVLSIEECWKKLREERDKILKSTDYTQLADAPISSEVKRLYREYRQYLRKLPNSYTDEYIAYYKVESFIEWRNRVHPK